MSDSIADLIGRGIQADYAAGAAYRQGAAVINQLNARVQDLQAELDSLRKSFMALRDDRDEWQAREEATIETVRQYMDQGVLDRDEFNPVRREILAEKRVEVKNRNG
jgi:outer membrane murein-binding lipoprotein Lpp